MAVGTTTGIPAVHAFDESGYARTAQHLRGRRAGLKLKPGEACEIALNYLNSRFLGRCRLLDSLGQVLVGTVVFGNLRQRLAGIAAGRENQSNAMEKSIHSARYAVFLRVLRDARERAGLTQVQLARRIGETQTFVSKCERGERRIDVIELRTFCQAFGMTLQQFVAALEKAITKGK